MAAEALLGVAWAIASIVRGQEHGLQGVAMRPEARRVRAAAERSCSPSYVDVGWPNLCGFALPQCGVKRWRDAELATIAANQE